MINWLTNVALDEHLKRSGNDALKQAAKKENVIIMYPQHYAIRMQISSCLMAINPLTCLYYKYMDLFWLGIMVIICSLNHWRYPIIGIRRSIDLVSAQIATMYHIYTAYYNLENYEWNIYISFFFIFLCFYGGAVYFGVNSDKNNASKSHFMMHLTGITANTYLYVSM